MDRTSPPKPFIGAIAGSFTFLAFSICPRVLTSNTCKLLLRKELSTRRVRRGRADCTSVLVLPRNWTLHRADASTLWRQDAWWFTDPAPGGKPFAVLSSVHMNRNESNERRLLKADTHVCSLIQEAHKRELFEELQRLQQDPIQKPAKPMSWPWISCFVFDVLPCSTYIIYWPLVGRELVRDWS